MNIVEFKPNTYPGNLQKLVNAIHFNRAVIYMIDERFDLSLKKRISHSIYKKYEKELISKGFIREEMSVNFSFIKSILKVHPYLIFYLKYPTEELFIRALKTDKTLIKAIENPTEQMQLVVVKSDGMYLRMFDNPSEEVIKAAVLQNIYALGDTDEYKEKQRLLDLQDIEREKQGFWFRDNKYINNIKYLNNALVSYPQLLLIVRNEYVEKSKAKLSDAMLKRVDDVKVTASEVLSDVHLLKHIAKRHPTIIFYLHDVEDVVIEVALKSKPKLIQYIIDPTTKMISIVNKNKG